MTPLFGEGGYVPSPRFPVGSAATAAETVVETSAATGAIEAGTASSAANHLKAGQAFEAEQLKSLGVPKNTEVWRPSQADIDSASFKAIVGPVKYTRGAQPVGTVIDSTKGRFLEIKGGSSPP